MAGARCSAWISVEAETFWTGFLRKLARRGLRGVKLVISDAHEDIKAAVARVLNATWKRSGDLLHFVIKAAYFIPAAVSMNTLNTRPPNTHAIIRSISCSFIGYFH